MRTALLFGGRARATGLLLLARPRLGCLRESFRVCNAGVVFLDLCRTGAASERSIAIRMRHHDADRHTFGTCSFIHLAYSVSFRPLASIWSECDDKQGAVGVLARRPRSEVTIRPTVATPRFYTNACPSMGPAIAPASRGSKPRRWKLLLTDGAQDQQQSRC